MMPLFAKGGRIVLESLSFTKTLYAFDFDGTLAKIVRVPSDAYMSKTTTILLRQLSELVPVAIISGRSISDMEQRLPFRPKFLVGNHGLEGIDDNPSSLEEAESVCNRWKVWLRAADFDSGIEIEDKRYSIAIHYRRSRHKAKAKTLINKAVSQLVPTPRIIPGKSVFNIVPLGAPHKGIAMLELLKRSGMKHLFYIGDDDTDEDVFGLPYSSGQIVPVRVGTKKKTQAAYFIERQSKINQLLKLLVRHHQPFNRKGVN